MILKTRHLGDVESRASFGTADLIPPSWIGYGSVSGEYVTTATAAGLPAVGRAIRLVGGLIGTSILSVFEGRKGDKQERPESTQARLFRQPYPGMADFDWRFDIAVALETTENAFLRKIKTNRGRLVALDPIPPRYVNAYLDAQGEKVFEISTSNGWRRAQPGEILHIRGQTVEGGPFGVSRLQQHRDPLGSMLAAQRFEGSYFKNDGRPGLVVETGAGTVTVEQANEWEDNYVARHSGPANAGRPTILGGGWKATTVPISLRDAQFVESRNLSVDDIGRIMDIESALLGATQMEQQDVNAVDRFLAFQVPPRLARIASALKADPDVFEQTSELYPEFTANPLMFASPLTRAEVQHKEIQAGTLLPDEARADNGRPPYPDGVGQIPQVTPVGGAPNPNPMPGASPGPTEE